MGRDAPVADAPDTYYQYPGFTVLLLYGLLANACIIGIHFDIVNLAALGLADMSSCTYVFLSVKALCWLIVSVCCGYTVSDSCSRGDVKDLSGENLQKLIETDHLYVNLLFLY